MADFAMLLTADRANRAAEFVATKLPLTVISQTPAPGTPLIEGMTVEVKAVSFNDIPWSVFEPTAPEVIRSVPVAEVAKLVNANAVILAASQTGDVAADKQADFALTLNQSLAGKGLTREVAAADTINIAKSLKSVGLLRG